MDSPASERGWGDALEDGWLAVVQEGALAAHLHLRHYLSRSGVVRPGEGNDRRRLQLGKTQGRAVSVAKPCLQCAAATESKFFIAALKYSRTR